MSKTKEHFHDEIEKGMKAPKVKVKTGRQIFAMLQRLSNEREKCKTKKTAAHPDTVFISGMLTMLTWVTSDVVDKEITQFINQLYKDNGSDEHS